MSPKFERDPLAERLPKRTAAEGHRVSFNGLLLPALDELLGVQASKAKAEMQRAALTGLVAAASCGFGVFDPGDSKEAKYAQETIVHHKLVRLGLNPCLEDLGGLVRKALASVEEVVLHLGDKVSEPRAPEPYLLALEHYTTLRLRLRLAQKAVSEGKALFCRQIPPFDEDEFNPLVRAVRTLVKMKDTAYLARLHRAKAAKRLHRPIRLVRRSDVSDADLLAVELGVSLGACAACTKLNRYLREHLANVTIIFRGNFFLIRGEGLPVDPYFRSITQPFLDYLANTKPPFKLSVCVVCGSVYDTTWNNTRGKYCSKDCRGRARKARSE